MQYIQIGVPAMRMSVAVLLLFSPMLSQAVPHPVAIDGHKLDEWTKAHEREKDPANIGKRSTYDMVRGAKMIGYVQGVIATSDDAATCIEDSADLGRVVGAVETWIDTHSDELDQRGDALVRQALRDSFPCAS